MAKGYVKALAEQINHQRALILDDEDEDQEERPRQENEVDGESSPQSGHCSVRSLIEQATERDLRASSGHFVRRVSGAVSEQTGPSAGHLYSKHNSNSKHRLVSPTKVNGDARHGARTLAPPGGEKFQRSRSASEAVHTTHSRMTTSKSDSRSPGTSPNRLGHPHTSPTSPQREMLAMNHGSKSKPKVPPKNPSLTLMVPNSRKTSLPTSLSGSKCFTLPPANTSSPSPTSSTSSSSPSPKSKSASLPSSFAQSKYAELCNTSSNHNSTSSDSSVASPDPSADVQIRPTARRPSEQYRDSVFKTIYDNAPPLNAAELFDSSWSDSDSYDAFSDEFDDDDEEAEVEDAGKGGSKSEDKKCELEEHNTSKVSEQSEGPPEDRRFKIASELLQTEKDYVARLHLLHQVFYFRLDKENRIQQFLPPDTLKHMFSNTKSIFLFHNDFLLPQLQDRMKNWAVDPRIGDLMKKNAPFLKMYSEYIRNFDKAMKMINQWMEKSSRFSDIIQDIQKMPECGSLSLQHHMLGPIQRVPRYEMLLKDYVRHLPEDSPDMNDAKDALDLVTKAACHSNEAMKKIETFHKLLDIYQSLRGVPVDFISPTREFVTQGPVTKIAARSGEKQPRQIFLFNDLVLVCTQYNLLGTYSVRSLLEVDNMEIKPGNNMHIPNTFMIHSKQRAVELLDENPSGEPFGWEKKIQDVISNYRIKKRSIRQDNHKEHSYEESVPESCLGKTAPVWIPDDAATMCMLCEVTFNMVRRRHHCRACGKLVCKSCCKKAPLEYKKGKIERVCATCYNVIVNKNGNGSPSSLKDGKKKGVLQIKASEPGLISSYLHCSEDRNSSTWQKLWVTAHPNFVLYSFRAHEDVSAISSLPLPGHKVEQVWDVESRPHVFSLSHKNKRIYYFHVDNEKKLKKWMAVLHKLVQAELPDESSRLSSQSNSSNGSAASDSAINNNNNSSSADNNNRSSTHSGSQADSGYPGDSNNSLAAFAGDENNGDDNADGISQYDNVEGTVTDV